MSSTRVASPCFTTASNGLWDGVGRRTARARRHARRSSLITRLSGLAMISKGFGFGENLHERLESDLREISTPKSGKLGKPFRIGDEH